MLKVYHFILDPRVGGPHVYVKSLASALGGEFATVVVTAGRGPITDIALMNIRRFWRPFFLLEVPLNVGLILLFSLLGKIEGRQSIFDVHGAANLSPIIAAWVLRVPVVWHFHETVPEFRVFARIGLLFVASLEHRLVIVADKIGQVYQLRNYSVIRPPVDLHYWRRELAASRGADEPQFFKVLCIGNLNRLKGQDVLLDALSKVNFVWRLSVAGAVLSNQKNYYRELERKAKVLCRQDCKVRIEFLGWQSHSDVRDLLGGCDVFVLPSRSEACPIILLEAMAMGCICIATDVGGVREIIDSGVCGYIVPAGNLELLSKTIETVRGMPLEARRVMAQAARARVESVCSMDKIAKEHLTVYWSLLRGVFTGHDRP